MSNFYNYNEVRSHDCYLSLIMSARGAGKTYGAKKIMIDAYIREGAQSMYIRRLDTELATRKLFFNDIKHAYPDWEFNVEGYTAYIRPSVPEGEENTNQWQILLYFVALSTSTRLKSTPYPLVKLMFYDEIIIATDSNQAYLKHEPRIFLELMSTVIRQNKGVRVFGLCNAVSFYNPFFEYFNVYVNPNKRFTKSPNNMVLLDYWTNDGYVEDVNQSEFGQFIQGTAYADYAVNNKQLTNNNITISTKRPPGQYTPLYTVQLQPDTKPITINHNRTDNTYYIDNTTTNKLHTITNNTHKPNRNTINTIKHSITTLSNSTIIYNNINTANTVQLLFKYCT